jgi:hypothetical protein
MESKVTGADIPTMLKAHGLCYDPFYVMTCKLIQRNGILINPLELVEMPMVIDGPKLE